ncbi:Tetraspanin-9 [Oryzias melastigma]|uniref:Tetraspanin-9 n=1 Tax=Oryzias melastigma TaxID=30732 RepID=A0A834FPP6_ORYME|nr:Tetraspanin-9 [Oryzias melastigma]
MEKSSSEESAIHRSPSVDSRDSDFPQASTSGRPFGGRGFTAGAFYGSTGPRKNAQQGQSGAAAAADAGTADKTNKYSSPKGSKYVVFYLDLSFVFLLEFKKCNMARGCLCCLKYLMFVFNLIFWLKNILRPGTPSSRARASLGQSFGNWGTVVALPEPSCAQGGFFKHTL